MKTTQPNKVDDCKIIRDNLRPVPGQECSLCGLGPCEQTPVTPPKNRRRRRTRPAPLVVTPRVFPDKVTLVEDEDVVFDNYVASSTGTDHCSLAMTVPSKVGGRNEIFRTTTRGCAIHQFWCAVQPNVSGNLVLRVGAAPNTVTYYLDARQLPVRVIGSLFSDLWQNGELDTPLHAAEEQLRVEARQRGYATMTPSLTTGFSALNFLWELKDFKSIYEVWKPIRDGWLGLRKRARQARYRIPHERGYYISDSKLARITLDEVANLVAQGKLLWDFAILPTVSDISKLLDIMSNFGDRTRKFLADAELLEKRRHYRQALTASSPLVNELTRTYWIPMTYSSDNDTVAELEVMLVPSFEPQAHVYGSTPSGSAVYCATMDFDYYVQSMLEFNNQLAGLLQQLGIKPDATILWNAVPFSFVVDWLYDVSDVLTRQASLDVISAEVNIHDWCESLRGRITWSLRVLSCRGAYDEPCQTLSVPDYTSCIAGQRYTRLPALPDVDKLPIHTADGITLNRALLSASLVKTITHNKGLPAIWKIIK